MGANTTYRPSEFAGLAAGSFVAATAGVLILLRTALAVYRLVWGGGNNSTAARR